MGEDAVAPVGLKVCAGLVPVITLVFVPVGGATAPVGGGAAAGLLWPIIQPVQLNRTNNNGILVIIKILRIEFTVAINALSLIHGPRLCYPVNAVGQTTAQVRELNGPRPWVLF